MAIDTIAKKRAVLGMDSIMHESLPEPDGQIDLDDKYVLIGAYPFGADTGDLSLSGTFGRFDRLGRRRALL